MFIDFHCHLNHPAFAKGIIRIVERMLEKNVLAVNTGFNIEGNAKALEQTALHGKSLRAAIGLSPHDVPNADIEKELAFIEQNARQAIAIGEIGMDFHHFKDPAQHKAQEKAFVAQLELAQKLGKPVVMHTRDAEAQVIDIVCSYTMPRILHFWLEPKLLTKALDCGMYVSIPTIKSKEQKKIFRNTPLDRMLLETDSPYGLNTPDRNEPSNVLVSYGRLAELRKMPLKEVELTIYENFKKITKAGKA
ncbi:TatD family hydrolase [Candidatus Micrarchaeota archaeon]|nr:TatD family hydrolase [Candidatus Micrarchaeota archaeon]